MCHHDIGFGCFKLPCLKTDHQSAIDAGLGQVNAAIVVGVEGVVKEDTMKILDSQIRSGGFANSALSEKISNQLEAIKEILITTNQNTLKAAQMLVKVDQLGLKSR